MASSGFGYLECHLGISIDFSGIKMICVFLKGQMIELSFALYEELNGVLVV